MARFRSSARPHLELSGPRGRGYPFRIEVICASLSLDRPDVKATVGRLHVVAQVYNPDHVIAEASGPLTVTAGNDTFRATWKLLQVSTALSGERLQRGDLVADAPAVKLTRAGEGDVEVCRQAPRNPSAAEPEQRHDL